MASEPVTTQPPRRSLYRSHRPRTFADVVGQDAVVRTLRNAVAQGRVHHAYLFVGSRGTGKTSMAKILAAALDCEHGPTTEPCGQCEPCRAIAAATSLDVIEMDAASNNSVDDIRELRDRIALAPVSGRHKVYILDEAHMLTQAAWNAFLKTLEEPPPATVFVLATTEAQKVPATVIDRCHRFDFHRPAPEQVAAVLARVAHAEGMELPPEALAAIARSARGSFRDALGTLEQLLTYSGERVELSDVLALLGATETELLERLLDAASAGDAAVVLTTLAECTERGRDPTMLASELEARAREALIVGTLGEVPRELSLTADSDARLAAQSERLDQAFVVRLLDLLAAAREAMRAGADPRTQLELALVKAARPEVTGAAGALLARVEQLEARLGVAREEQPDAPSAVPRAPARARALRPQTDDQTNQGPAASAETAVEEIAAADPACAGAVPEGVPVAVTAPGQPAGAETVPEAAAAAASSAPTGSREPGSDEVAVVSSRWPHVLATVRARNAMLGAVLAEAKPVTADGDAITLAFPTGSSFLRRKAEDAANLRVVTGAFKETLGRPVRVSFELRDDVVPEPHTPGEEELIELLVAELGAEELPVAELSERP